MTDDNGADAPPVAVPEKSIKVDDSAARELTWQSFRTFVVFGAGAGAVQVFHSEMVAGLAVAAATALVAALPAVIAYAFGFYRALVLHHQRRVMADLLPNSVAQVVGKKGASV